MPCLGAAFKNMYHETVHEPTPQSYKDKVLSEERRVLGFFLSNPGVSFTAADIYSMWPGEPPLLTNIRRCLSDLSIAPVGDPHKWMPLIKLEEKKKGLHGRSNHLYALRKPVRTIQLDLFHDVNQ